MKLSIYSIQSTIFQDEIRGLTLNTSSGEITILDNHIPLISTVSSGKLRIVRMDNSEEEISLFGGIIEVRPKSEVVILAREKGL